ncbi:putative M18 family aminopeptidase 2 [Vreelandella aquamarina]|jgi:aspartyl aminopeptidase|uniref:M18 family aminopeptidase n=1 Tax=Vreelandella aquamarina TaxID=77097 RepID=A0A0D7V183_9GAMM|nr:MULTISPECIES: M18 family aminopeptidase [Halomonas]MEC9304606.1 M18 family aminopeptidase [Pseudomonadota bacterium]HBP79840.1 M18 family aminopeptidase [Halomonas sp.]KJD20591.1 aminopeptidase [Halomonas meridiana]MDC8443036.1 M18 family aminopeptidase [Halomonas aquamarina]MEE3268563.1 M18 family aminopeptidase [Pseudomonadota bacterium]|tara:strand:+ start:765 stop:2069 length:1305 start_codon:yes stop_codon:yes gene_type:complete
MSEAFNAERLTRLCGFLQQSPTPWHATQRMVERLEQAGFARLEETANWQLSPGKRYYVTRNDSSVIAFQLPAGKLTSLRMLGAHTDSPGLSLKPNATQYSAGWLQLGVQVYGGVLLAPWFDRDLGLAGRVHVRHADGRLESVLLNVARPIAMIPSLAIHMDRDVNAGRSINPQTQMAPVLMQSDTAKLHELLGQWLEEQHGLRAVEVVDFELGFYDVQPPSLVGLRKELLASARLDNLLSCFVGLEALLESDGSQGALLVANDHEEVGSASACGAQGPFLSDVLKRLNAQVGGGSEESLIQLIQSSLMISCDNAHALHPNFRDKHDERHGPAINGGPVIKVNASQRYATNSVTGALFRDVCREADVPVQSFVTRADMGCGSTIGPITATEVGVPTIDVGLPQWAMHSIRETSGTRDVDYLTRALTVFLNRPTLS